MQSWLSFAWGIIFGIGLIVSQMVNPTKVEDFLRFWSAWDPSLAFVMGGGILVTLPLFLYARRRKKTFFGGPFHWPEKRMVFDKRMIAGSAIFGIGWGLAGICPGPGLVIAGSGDLKGIYFTISMIIGMILYDRVISKL